MFDPEKVENDFRKIAFSEVVEHFGPEGVLMLLNGVDEAAKEGFKGLFISEATGGHAISATPDQVDYKGALGINRLSNEDARQKIGEVAASLKEQH